jgi:hypothetical protein
VLCLAEIKKELNIKNIYSGHQKLFAIIIKLDLMDQHWNLQTQLFIYPKFKIKPCRSYADMTLSTEQVEKKKEG